MGVIYKTKLKIPVIILFNLILQQENFSGGSVSIIQGKKTNIGMCRNFVLFLDSGVKEGIPFRNHSISN